VGFCAVAIYFYRWLFGRMVEPCKRLTYASQQRDGSSKRCCHPLSGIGPGLFFPMKIRADIRAALAAGLTGEPAFDIG